MDISKLNRETHNNYISGSSLNIETLNRAHESNENKQQSLIRLSKKSEKKVSFWYDARNFFMLFSIYAASGLSIGYFDYSLTIILTKAGASYSQLSLISFIIYPYSLKFIMAPLCDAYYIKGCGLGKRKTYIVISYYIVGILFFVCAFYVNGWIYGIEAGIITVIGFIIITMVALQSIGTDAWSVSVLHPDNITYAALSLNLGEDLGIIVAYNVFIWLNLRGGSTIEEQLSNEIMSSRTLFFIMAVIFFLVAVGTHYLKKETQEYDAKYESLMTILGEMKGFLKNKNLILLMVVFVFAEFAFASIANCASIILIQKGFSTDMIDTFDLSSTFVGMLGYLISARYSKMKKEWTLYLACLFIRFFLDVGLYFIVMFYDSGINDSKMTIYYGVIVNIYAIVEDCYGMALYSFILRIAESNMSVGATFITVLACVSNFGGSWTYTLAVWLLDYWSFTTLTLVTWGYGLIFFGLLGRKIRAMEDVCDDDWNLALTVKPPESNEIEDSY